MDTCGPSLLGKTDDGCGDAPGHGFGVSSTSDRHREVCIFIDNRDYVGQEPVSLGGKEVTVPELVVIELDIGDIGLAQELVTLFHLEDQRLEHLFGLICFLDDRILLFLLFIVAGKYRKVVVKQPAVGGEFDHLGVDEHEF